MSLVPLTQGRVFREVVSLRNSLSAPRQPTGCQRFRSVSSRRHAVERQAQPTTTCESPQQRHAGRQPLPPPRRALGLDYGRRTVGLAVSTLGLAPRPLEGLPGPAAHEQLQLAAEVLGIAQREGCDAIVVGLPVTLEGSLRDRSSDSQQGRRCRNFAHNMAAAAASHGIRVFLANERGSTVAAVEALTASGGGRRTDVAKRKDSVAAAVILSTFFEDPTAALLVRSWLPARTGWTGREGHQRHQQQPWQQGSAPLGQHSQQQRQRQQQGHPQRPVYDLQQRLLDLQQQPGHDLQQRPVYDSQQVQQPRERRQQPQQQQLPSEEAQGPPQRYRLTSARPATCASAPDAAT